MNYPVSGFGDENRKKFMWEYAGSVAVHGRVVLNVSCRRERVGREAGES